MQSGTVRWYSRQGYGFIDGGDKDFYFHVVDVVGRRILKPGEMVSFDVVPCPRGLKAVRVDVKADEANDHEHSDPAVR
jgi:cold shock CspA family protein